MLLHIYQDGFLYNALEKGELKVPKASELVTDKGSEISYILR